MKAIFIIIIFVLALFMSAQRQARIAYSPLEKPELNLAVLPHYIIFPQKACQFLSSNEVAFAPDFYVYILIPCELNGTVNFKIGEWRTRSDTLLIYQDTTDFVLFSGKEKPDNNSDSIDWALMPPNLHYRNLYDNFLPRNVSAFKIINKGDSLLAIGDDGMRLGLPISKKAYSMKHHGENKYKVEARETWQDTFVWKLRKKPMLNIFTISSVIRTGSQSVTLEAKNENIIFNILNPRYYPQSEALLYAQRREYCEWFDRVNVGDTISLELTRAAYEQEVFDRSPYLKGYPDTIYVLDNEAYGYWFAKPIFDER